MQHRLAFQRIALAALLSEKRVDIGVTAIGAGELVFVGRTTEMIKKGGINISPAEVEDMLMQHPAVSQVGVVGIPDARQGELLAAFIVLRTNHQASREEIAEHCRATASRYKVPDIIEFRSELPITATGKLMRRELKVLAMGEKP